MRFVEDDVKFIEQEPGIQNRGFDDRGFRQ